MRANFFAGDAANRGGVRVSVKNLDGDARADLVTAPGVVGGGRVSAFAGAGVPADGPAAELFGGDPFAGAADGVFVG